MKGRPHPVKRPHPASFLGDPFLVKERIRTVKTKKSPRRSFLSALHPLLNKERVAEERGGVRSLDGVRFP